MDWTEMLAANAETFGEAITVTPRVGAAVNISDAVWSEIEPRTEQSDAGEKQVRTARVRVKNVSQLPKAERRASLLRVLTGETWTVDDVQYGPPPGLRLTVVRQIVREQTAGRVLDK